MKERIKKLLRKFPLIFQIIKGSYMLFLFVNTSIKVLFADRTDAKIYSVFNKFCQYSGLSGGKINSSFIDEKTLNTNDFDIQIEKVILKYYSNNKNKFAAHNIEEKQISQIGVLFTELYATGGHTPLIERIVESFHEEFDLKLFCTRLDFTENGHYKEKNNNLCSKFKIYGVNWNFGLDKMTGLIISLYNQIVESKRDIIFCYIHPHDIILVATLALLKNTTNIKIIDINIQDHFYSLGFRFAHLIVDARPAGQYITKDIRGYKNTIILPLQREAKEITIYYSEDQINRLKNGLGIAKDNYFTLTGTAGYKIFGDEGSPYLEMIRDLLIEEPKLKHVLMTEWHIPQAKEMFNNVFKYYKDLLNRIIVIDRVPEFDIYMQACDLFIDSFPQGGATIHIDMMRNKKPTVLKMNKENPVRSFEYYFPIDYEYMYENVQDMKKGVLKLLHSKEKQNKASECLYKHYLENFEFNIVREKYKKIIEHADNLEVLYES